MGRKARYHAGNVERMTEDNAIEEVDYDR